jgi:hypothetical protein
MVSLGCTFSAMPWVKIRIQCNGLQWGIIHGYACGTLYIYMCVYVCILYVWDMAYAVYMFMLCRVYVICRYVLIYTRLCENIGVWDCMQITKDIKDGLDWIGKSIHGGYPTPNKLMAFK